MAAATTSAKPINAEELVTVGTSHHPMPVPGASNVGHFFAGAMAGMIASFLTCPLEVIKTRAQSVSGPRQTFIESLRVDRALGTVFRAEGVRGLWRGVVPNVAGVVPARATYFYVVDKARTRLQQQGMSGSALNLAAAAIAGATTSTVLSPVWVIKTRLQIQTNKDLMTSAGTVMHNYTGPIDAFKQIVRQEGVKGLFRGLSASYLGVTEGATQFMLYQKFKTMSKEAGVSQSVGLSFGLSALAKLIASAATYPHELVRTRMRDRSALDAFGQPKYRGLFHTFKVVVHEEGVAALYHGLGPHLIRVVPNAAILFCLMEVFLGGNM